MAGVSGRTCSGESMCGLWRAQLLEKLLGSSISISATVLGIVRSVEAIAIWCPASVLNPPARVLASGVDDGCKARSIADQRVERRWRLMRRSDGEPTGCAWPGVTAYRAAGSPAVVLIRTHFGSFNLNEFRVEPSGQGRHIEMRHESAGGVSFRLVSCRSRHPLKSSIGWLYARRETGRWSRPPISRRAPARLHTQQAHRPRCGRGTSRARRNRPRGMRE